MKNLNKTLGGRNSERGAIAILIAAMWTTLFGLAAFAVDVGYLYTRQRGIQSTADAAVVAGMPSIQGGNQSTASTRATSVANLNGYTGGDIVAVTPTATSLTVQLQKQYPTFFGKVLGMNSRTLTARSEGRLISTGSGAVIHARAACGVGVGFTIQGNATFNVTGDIESNGILRIWWPGGGTMTGTAKYLSTCPGEPQIAGYPMPPTSPAALPYPDPVAKTPADFAALCTVGTIGGAGDPMVGVVWGCGAGPGGSDVLPSGVYCSAGNFNIASTCIAQNIYAPDSTFVSAGGAITFGSNNGITLGKYPGAPGNIIAMTMGVGGINMGTANAYTVDGVIYAPFGLINGGGGGTAPTINNFNGALVANQINLGLSAGAIWNFNGGGAISGGWRLYQ
jgi:hypothetical protein